MIDPLDKVSKRV